MGCVIAGVLSLLAIAVGLCWIMVVCPKCSFEDQALSVWRAQDHMTRKAT